MSTALLALSHPLPVTFTAKIVSFVTTLYIFAVTENPIVWKWRQGKNQDADQRGPFYIHGAPSRQLEEGKGILASLDLLKKYGVYLLTGRITDPEGKPVSGATLDFWHASSNAVYYFNRYELRGKIKTDADGCFQVISVPPGGYLGRPGHFHCIITPSAPDRNKYEDLTTQSYLCIGNNKDEMNADPAAKMYLRDPPYQLMINSWSIPEANEGKSLLNLPPMAEIVTDDNTREKTNTQIKEWNDRLAQLEDFKGENALRVVAGGHKELQLSAKGTLGLW